MIGKRILIEYCINQFDNKTVEWYDVVSILYDSKILNFVYIKDDLCDAGVHYLTGYSEYQVMKEFMHLDSN